MLILSQEWKQAMQVEFDALMAKNTWDLAPRYMISILFTPNRFIRSNKRQMGVSIFIRQGWWHGCRLYWDISPGALKEEVFIEQPCGFIDPIYSEHVCRLKKVLYGFKQASRAWFLQLSNIVLDLGFVSSSVDSSLFTFHYGKVLVFVLIYVDDLLITGVLS